MIPFTTITGTENDDVLAGPDNLTNYSILGLDGNDSLTGNDQNDILVGGEGYDTLVGGAGSDTLDGGNGDDFYFVDSSDLVIDSDGTDTVIANDSYTLGAGLEHLDITIASGEGLITYYGTGNDDNNLISAYVTIAEQYFVLSGAGGDDTLNGSTQADTLYGGDGNDFLSGGTGYDNLFGGAGDDTYYLQDGDYLSEFAGEGDDTVDVSGMTSFSLSSGYIEHFVIHGRDGLGFNATIYTGTDVTLTAMVDDWSAPVFALQGGSGNDRITGAGYGDTLHGNAGNDTLVGGAGADQLWGGAGDDLYYVDASDSFYESAGEGDDTLDISGTTNFAYTNAYFEHFVIHGSGAGVFTATVYGSTGITLAGVIDDASNTTLELQGGSGDDSITGAGFNDLLVGGDGNDTLDGGAAIDDLAGGLGDDTYFVTAGDIIVDVGGIDTVVVDNTSYTLGADLENLVTYGGEGASVVGQGNASANLLDASGAGRFTLGGFGGDDTLRGSVDGDVLEGGWGRDALSGNNGNDLLAGEEGNDSLWCGNGDDQALGGNGADKLGGAAGMDTLNGQAGNDELYGGDDQDLLIGDDGNDKLWGDAGWDDLYGGAGADLLDGGDDADVLWGGSQADTLLGGAGNDYLIGEWGSDSLLGDAGADFFVFSYKLGVSGVDAITDFTSGTDTVYIGRSLTNLTNEGGLWSERLAYGTDASESDDRFVFDSTTGSLYYDADGSNAGAKVLFATLNAGATLVASDIYMYDSLV